MRIYRELKYIYEMKRYLKGDRYRSTEFQMAFEYMLLRPWLFFTSKILPLPKSHYHTFPYGTKMNWYKHRLAADKRSIIKNVNCIILIGKEETT